jgi:hypothetical protein
MATILSIICSPDNIEQQVPMGMLLERGCYPIIVLTTLIFSVIVLIIGSNGDAILSMRWQRTPYQVPDVRI